MNQINASNRKQGMKRLSSRKIVSLKAIHFVDYQRKKHQAIHASKSM